MPQLDGEQLGQLRPADTNAASLYSPNTGQQAEITKIVVCETSGATPTFRIFHDDDGTTYDQSTALYYNAGLSANETKEIETNWFMSNPSGNIGVRSSSANAITFTAYGKVRDKNA